ncbi:putative E3 ubiquitin-protein ligase ARI8 [Acorus calamus]|uniref:E3 ubiquitin-protein ligase ARI8 n=1 Tax=Acorus calamus TaxID=4465 RepID=A0AAV9C9A1_ACOCL|nr:putative E3 ubiquitin-protein ligase ARI8 [Acorus calamus]
MCGKPNEKNHGQMRVTCTSPCAHEFCWVCLHVRRILTLGLDWYAHCFEKWSANDASMVKAVAELQGLEAGELARLGERRVLRWSNAYGYFLPREEEGKKKVFFEFLQGAAEAELERLHRLAEVELQVSLDTEG